MSSRTLKILELVKTKKRSITQNNVEEQQNNPVIDDVSIISEVEQQNISTVIEHVPIIFEDEQQNKPTIDNVPIVSENEQRNITAINIEDVPFILETEQLNNLTINIQDVPIIFEDELLITKQNNNESDFNEVENTYQCNETSSTLDMSTVSCSKSNNTENSDSESCSSIYEPQSAEEESNSNSDNNKENEDVNLHEIQHDQPVFGNMEEGRKRRKKAIQSEWKKYKNEKLREKGKEYLGYSRSKDGKVKQDSKRPERKMGLPCNSPFCRKSSKRECHTFSDEKRKELFEQFWSSLSWDQKKIYVCSHVLRSDTKRKTDTQNEISRREGSFSYTLTNGEKKVPVCRQFFLSTLGLRPFTVQTWVKESKNSMKEEKNQQNEKRKSKHYRVKQFREQNEFLDKFFEDLPKQPSHYVRKNTNKLYVEQHFTSMKQLFDHYLNKCQNDAVTPLGRYVFEKKFKEKNLSLFSPKKDQCDICIQYEHGNVSEEQWKNHIDKKEKVRKEKENDIIEAKENRCILLTMDLQAVKVAPYLNATSIYFKTKLSCHNFTIYNVGNHDVACYWFTEIDTNLNASTFVSCLLDYITKNCLPFNLPIIVYSDGCTFQNRNVVLANALLNYSTVHNITIIQKYLEKGHTQMEVDSVHSCIERKLKNRKIHLPSDYLQATEEARKHPEPYKAIKLEYDFFKDYSQVETFRYTSIRPGKKTSDPTVTDIVAMKYSSNNLQFKLDFNNDWDFLPLRQKVIDPILEYPQAHISQLPIKKKKWLHLQELKSVIPQDCWLYYDNLPHDNN